MTIAYTDLAPIPEDMARQVLSIARSIAPCLGSLEDEPKKDAIAVLKAVGTAGMTRGSHLIKSQKIAEAAVEYVVDGSWFSADNRAALRALCSAGVSSSSLPLGDFPTSRPIAKIWPCE